jgi:hypothetical protein
MKLSRVYLAILLPIHLCIPLAAIAQLKTPDTYYRNQIKLIDSLSSRRLNDTLDKPSVKKNLSKSVDIYKALSKTYTIDNPISFFYYSIREEDAEGFYQSCKLLMLNTADSVNDIIKQFGNVYGGNDVGAIEREPLLSGLKRIKKEEGKLIDYARLHIDWNWNMSLCALNKSNIDFREIPMEYFKDTAAWLDAMTFIDSVHFTEFCELVAEHGFPYKLRVGLNAGQIMAPLRHFAALVYFKEDMKRADFFIEKWKFLMPDLYSAAKTSQIDRGFYGYLLDWLKRFLKRDNRKQDIIFFNSYRL